MEIDFPIKNRVIILALGAESAGNFSVYKNGKIYFSEDFGDLLEEENWKNFKKAVLNYLKNEQIKPAVILTDLHPLFHTTLWGRELAQKYKANYLQTQHHIAHIFSSIGDKMIDTKSYKLKATSYAFACDGTGYGLDGKIWGGEIFQVKSSKLKVKSINRIGHLENQILIGGDLAIKEPARILIGVLSKFLNKQEIYGYIKKYYSWNVFELLYGQLEQNFNCQETSSTGRVLDAVSLLLGFCKNVRKYKHEPIDLLEKNSTKPYSDLKPKIIKELGSDIRYPTYTLDTTHLFNYVIKYLHKKDHRRLAATAQLYLAEGLYEIIYKCHPKLACLPVGKVSGSHEMPKQVRHDNIFFAGGMANNKIISEYLASRGAYTNKKIPRGDAGLSFGQVIHYLLANPRY